MIIKVILADDHQIIRDGLRSLLENEPDIEIVGEANNGRVAVQMAQELQPNVVVMDITMPDLNGIEATRQILTKTSRVKVLALSMHSDEQFVAGVLAAGASGYILKDCTLVELIRAIRTVAMNQTYLSPRITNVVIEGYVCHSATPASSMSTLTIREREVLQLIAEGKTVKEIAAALYVSHKTVEKHREQIMRKLNIHSVAELTKYAIRKGLTTLED
jgi:DNA-binding NarL/FixJ family response regulator